MTQLDLGRADLALFTDPVGTRVHIPRLMSLTRTRERLGVDVQFDGDEYPTPFDGEGRRSSFEVACRYGDDERPERVALEHLVDELAPRQFDKRLLLRLHLDTADGLSAELQAYVAAGNVMAVRVRRVVSTPIGAGVCDLSFSATVVQHRFGTA